MYARKKPAKSIFIFATVLLALVVAPLGATSLCDAAIVGDLEAIHAQLAAGADVNCAAFPFKTPLHLAVEHGHEAAIQGTS